MEQIPQFKVQVSMDDDTFTKLRVATSIVTQAFIRDKLNEILGNRWGFLPIREFISGNKAVVYGELTIYWPSGLKTTQGDYGDRILDRDGSPSYGDAADDCLIRCASLYGMGAQKDESPPIARKLVTEPTPLDTVNLQPKTNGPPDTTSSPKSQIASMAQQRFIKRLAVQAKQDISSYTLDDLPKDEASRLIEELQSKIPGWSK